MAGHVTETDLVGGLQRGDGRAFQDMVARYSGELFGLAFALMGNAADAEDVVQQVYLGAFERIGSFEGRSSLKTWLISILLNQASKARQSLRVRRAVSLDGGSGGDGGWGASDGPHTPATRSGSPAVDSRVDVMTMLGTLSPEHRDVIVLRELERLTYEEIADALKIPRGTVESRLFRARRELRQRYAEYLA